MVFGCFSWPVSKRQVYTERGALSGCAVHVDKAFVLFDDTVDSRETEPGAAPRLFGGKKRLKNVGQRLRIHSDAGIDDAQEDVVAQSRVWMQPLIIVVDGDISRQRSVARRRAWHRGHSSSNSSKPVQPGPGPPR